MPENSTVTKKKSTKRQKNNNIYMLNAVWFNPDGGEQRYMEYMKAAGPLIRRVGGRKLRSFVTDRELIGEFDPDLVFFIEYPDWQAFKDFANSADHHKIAYLREEALDKSILVRCNRPG